MRRSTNSFFSHQAMLVFTIFLACCFSQLRVSAQQDALHYGCTDTMATNWSAEAIYEDGSCVYDSVFEIHGCTDSQAINYDQFATIDNGTCEFDLDSNWNYGCTDTMAINWNAEAVYDDGSCYYDSVFEIHGCTDSQAINYDQFATIDNGTCEYDLDSNWNYGCTDTMAINWNAEAVYDDGSCYYDSVFEIHGCTDSQAINYDQFATIDNGTCEFDLDSNWNYGCTDTMAINWDSHAYYDDGSCVYDQDTSVIYGCTDPEAVNYNVWANTSDGTCTYAVETYGCTNEFASNFNPWATEDDGSCQYTDTLVETYVDCSFDYNATIDDAYISSYQTLGDSLAIVEWVIVQDQITTHFEVYYFDFWSGLSVCYLYVSCDSTSNWQAKAEQGANSFTISDEVNFSVVSSNNEMLEGAEIGLFPQPAIDRITLILPEIYSGNGEVTIRNVAGKTVLESKIDLNAFGKEIDLSGFVTGMYFIQVTQSGSVIATDQFLKE